MNRDRIITLVARGMGAVHTALYRRSGGRFGGRFRGAPCLLLTVTGRRSGQPRTAPLMYGRDGDDYIIIASKGGSDIAPVWWLNLRSNPAAEVEVGAERRRVTAEQVEGEERERLWRLMAGIYPNYDAYQRRTERVIPVVRLRPAA
ncbi:MAG TPA: nitroreductase family deazaflavin-dependent oxidoreductase [Candidatus Dormibacteraeota bacterium]|jgi:deazaflavin-dependent oxidoreductase (nitroreductase family)|nr:nitroreductase family deazaflavin-dependent oxidoreductase [Candidatus Dormibacteraeota bacterium]